MSLVDMNGVPINGTRPNEHQVATAFRKLHLEPNDIIVVRDASLTPDDIIPALASYSCGHNPLNCNGHRIVFAPDGIESVSRMMLEELLKSMKESVPDVTGAPV